MLWLRRENVCIEVSNLKLSTWNSEVTGMWTSASCLNILNNKEAFDVPDIDTTDVTAMAALVDGTTANVLGRVTTIAGDSVTLADKSAAVKTFMLCDGTQGFPWKEGNWALIKGVVITSGGSARVYGSCMIEEIPEDDVENDEEPLETPGRLAEE